MGVPGGRAVPAERLQSEGGPAGKSFTGPLEKVGDSTDRGGGSRCRSIADSPYFLGLELLFVIIGQITPQLNTSFLEWLPSFRQECTDDMA